MDLINVEERAAGWALLPPRIALGATMAYHGGSKLTKEGLAQHSGFFEQLGFKPGKRWVMLTGITEVAAGVLSVLGIGTRIAALAVIGTQAVAVSKVHAAKGFNNQQGGFEFNLALMTIALAMLLGGPGRASTHAAVRGRIEGKGARRWLRLGHARQRRSILGALLA